MSDPEGRRIYIARNGLRKSVAEHGGAYAVSYALAATRGARIISHNLEDPFGIARQLVRPQVSSRLIGRVVATREGTLDNYLKRTGYMPKRPIRAEPLLPLLRQGESTFATCYDSDNNWYTVATGVAAADRMWQDAEPAHSLLDRLSVSAEELPEDIKDLTVITADDELMPIELNDDGTYARTEVLNKTGKGNRRLAREVDSQTRQSYLRYLGGVGLDVYHEMLADGDGFTDDEMSIMVNIFAACKNSLATFASY
jgi:hypothetical protein